MAPFDRSLRIRVPNPMSSMHVRRGSWQYWFLPRDAMHNRGYAVMSLRPSVTFMGSVETNTHI